MIIEGLIHMFINSIDVLLRHLKTRRQALYFLLLSIDVSLQCFCGFP